MITLAFDTTGPWCSCAIVTPARILAESSLKIGRGHAERLAPMTDSVLKRANVTAGNIDRIAVCTGPGSFTGLRVALAFARGFALPRKIPVIGLSALRVLAAEADPEHTRKIVSVIDAKRGEVCWAVYEAGIEIRAPSTMTTGKAKSIISKMQYDFLIGDGSEALELPRADIDHVNGAVLAWTAQSLSPDMFPPDPFYVRGPDAKLPGGKTL